MPGLQIKYSGEKYETFYGKVYFPIRNFFRGSGRGDPTFHSITHKDQGYIELEVHFPADIIDKNKLIEKLKDKLNQVEGIDMSKLEIDTIKEN